MISIVIPTYNRGDILEKTLPSYYTQKSVDEIVVVDDASEDITKEVIERYQKKYPDIKTVYHCNKERRGAAYNRNKGVSLATNEYILFGEDDAFLEENYSEALLEKLTKTPKAAVISGRLVQLLAGEEPSLGKERFGYGTIDQEFFDFKTFTHNPGARFKGDITLPLTHSLILAQKSLLLRFPYDEYYSKGNGFREESTFQMQAFIHDYDIVVTNDTHCMHMHEHDVRRGGQRSSHFRRFYYNVVYTKRFYDMYYHGIKERLKVKRTKNAALAFFIKEQVVEYMCAALCAIKKRSKNLFLRGKKK
jgi:glycosyltransferase involved in cell wall biosynthesis